MFEQRIASVLNISDPELYGNDAADDEDIRKLVNYFVEVPESALIFDPIYRLVIIRAKKGIGKSALLRIIHHKKANDLAILSVYLKESDFHLAAEKYPFPETEDAGHFVHVWQQRICYRLAYEIGKIIKIPTDYMEYCLKFNSNQIGSFLDKNIVKGIVDHITVKLSELEVSTKNVDISNSIQLMNDYSRSIKAKKIWLMIDDIDASFVFSSRNALSLTSFVNACRNIIRENQNVTIRCSLRTDVMFSVIDENETTDKTEQYYFDIKWSQRELKHIVAKRCRIYLLERIRDVETREYLRQQNADYFVRLLFKGVFAWAGYKPTNMLNVYSAGRPRWALQLMRLAAGSVTQKGNRFITLGEIRAQMHKYGASRVAYVCAEHKHQCNHLQELLVSFSRQDDIYQYPVLKSLVATIVQKLNEEFQYDPLQIDHEIALREKVVVEFLFKIGFINKKDFREGSKKLVKFEDEPLALADLVGLDTSYWEIHPAFRYYLQLRDTKNGEDYTVE